MRSKSWSNYPLKGTQKRWLKKLRFLRQGYYTLWSLEWLWDVRPPFRHSHYSTVLPPPKYPSADEADSNEEVEYSPGSCTIKELLMTMKELLIPATDPPIDHKQYVIAFQVPFTAPDK